MPAPNDSIPGDAGARYDLDFCCSGCVAAWHILQGRELPDFVTTPADEDADPALKAFDLPEISREYLQPRASKTGDGDAAFASSSTPERSSAAATNSFDTSEGLRLELDVQGIHCQSCVTVCERSLERLPEVERVAVDYETGRARIDFRARGAATGAPAYISRAVRQLRLVGYDGTPLKPGRKTEALRGEGRSLLWKIVLSGFAAGNTMMLSIALWSGYFDGSLPIEYKRLFEWMQFLLTTPVYLYAARVFHRGWRGFFRTGTIGMDVLISAGISAAYFYSVFVFLRPLAAFGEGPRDLGALTPGLPTAEVYFDSVAMIVFLLLVGRYLEWRARLRQRERMESLLRPLPDFCLRLAQAPATAWPQAYPLATTESFSTIDAPAQITPVSELRPGDLVLLRAGESVPADGVLVGPAACDVDEAVLTGEARAVLRAPGDRMLAGSRLILVGDTRDGESPGERSAGGLACAVLRVTAAPGDSSLGILARITDATGNRRSRIEHSTGRLVPYFGFAVIAIAAASFTYFYAIAGAGLEQALLAAVSVLIVSCPCALALSVPTAAGAALFMGLREGVLFRDGRVLEEIDTIRDFCFDKTGTLTTGRPRVIASHVYSGDASSAETFQSNLAKTRELIRVMESGTMHPVGLALLDFARGASTNAAAATDDDRDGAHITKGRALTGDDFSAAAGGEELRRIQSVAGRGLYLAGEDARIGSLSFLGVAESRERFQRDLGVTEEATLVGVTLRGRLLAVFALSDEAREDARETLDFLRDRRCRVSMLTGDQE
ncbi:MAG: HAD family hydrolase, partial [Leptospirales bacterium]